MNFDDYLREKGIIDQSIRTMTNLLNAWVEWLPVQVHDSSYKHLMEYISHLHDQQKSVHHINKSLQTISHYYQFKKLPNIALTTRIRGTSYKALSEPLTIEQMENLYQCFDIQPGQNYFQYSDKIILGLIIYQALEMGDFMTLELKDIDLQKGTIYVPERRLRKSRTIPLQPHQILQLHTYLTHHRETLKTPESDKLLSPQGDDYHQLHWQFKKLSKHLKDLAKAKLDIRVRKLLHLRQSRIAFWVKSHGLRKAQYLAGFRTVLSAERYRKADLKNLKEQVKRHHPLK